MVNPKSIKNLRQFQPGNKGKPVGTISIVAALKRHLKEHPEDVRAIIEAWVKEAKDGNAVALRELVERIDGKVPQAVQASGDITLRVVYDAIEQAPDDGAEKSGQAQSQT